MTRSRRPRPAEEPVDRTGVRPYRYVDAKKLAAAREEKLRAEREAELEVERRRTVDGRRHAAVSSLMAEFLPGMDPAYRDSLVAEALAQAEQELPTTAELEPQARWNTIRRSLPAPRKSATDQPQSLVPYAERRRRETLAAGPQEGDFRGRQVTGSAHRMGA